jgi:hypothetical protein
MKLNYFKFRLMDWRELALFLLIFDPWLFKIACEAKSVKPKGSKFEFPETPEVFIGLVDLDLEDIEVFLPPHVWDAVKESIVKIDWEPKGR